MKYFTKEELVDITKELIENPTRETLKNLNNKYNGSAEVEKNIVGEPKIVSTETMETPVLSPVDNQGEQETIETTPVMPIPVVTENQNIEPLPNFNVPNVEVTMTEPIANQVEANMQMPSLDLPKVETPAFNNQVNFNGNLFEPQNNMMPNLMQTTDNFNSVSNTTVTTEVPVAPMQFFVTSPESVNNPIPVTSEVNNVPNQGPSMLGQFEQNYM